MTITHIKGLPLQSGTARKTILELFSLQSQWNRKDLVSELMKRHLSAGGVLGVQSPTAVVKHSLGVLRQEGRVEQVGYGIWISVDPSSAIEVAEDVSNFYPKDIAALPLSKSVDLELEEYDDDEVLPVFDQITIGQGQEAVYLYFNPNDRELAKFRGSDIWECKIGLTKHLPVTNRIFSQGIKTALSKMPIIGLVILTENCVLAERAIHTALSHLSLEAPDSPGMEWFLTNPKLIADWYKLYLENLNILSQTPSSFDSSKEISST